MTAGQKAGIDRLYIYSSIQKYGCLLYAGTVLDTEDVTTTTTESNPYYKVLCLWEVSPMNNQVETWYMKCLRESK